jgi:hypothetical protein
MQLSDFRKVTNNLPDYKIVMEDPVTETEHEDVTIDIDDEESSITFRKKRIYE